MSTRIIIIDTNYPVNTRNNRIFTSLIEKYGKENVGIIAWNRQADTQSPDYNNIFVYNNVSPLGNKLDKLKRLKGFSRFINETILYFKPYIIIASHWDSLILAIKYKGWGKKIIYENLDMPSGSKPVRYLLRNIESYCLRRTDAIVHASRFFKDHYEWFRKPQIIVENYPMVKRDQKVLIHNQSTETDDSLHIVFNGGLRYALSMINLIKAVENISKIQVDFWGYPIGEEGQIIVEAGKNVKNVNFHGAYKYDEIEKIMKKADILWAAYSSSSFNVKNAISNKFHESLFYEIPGIYARNTKLGSLVESENIGITVDESSIEDIRTKLLNICDNKSTILSRVRTSIRKYKASQPINWDEGFSPFIALIESLK